MYHNLVYTAHHVHTTFHRPPLTQYPTYTRSHINYSSSEFRCSLTSSSGSPVSFNCKFFETHLLAARWKIEVSRTEGAALNIIRARHISCVETGVNFLTVLITLVERLE